MCGIAGIIDPGGSVDVATLEAMARTLSHRGPDDQGAHAGAQGRWGLAHRRLSILDLSQRGHQPMCDAAGQVWLVYNGEVYNFRHLRDELGRCGRRFETDTDTEVILQGYLQWGIEVIERLEGMFALAIHDTRSGRTWLVRDRLGVKPLFYASRAGKLIFASEMRAILAAAPRLGRDLSPASAADFFTYGYVPAPRSIYADVHKLLPGHVLAFGNGRMETRRWWKPRFESLDDSPETARRRLVELFDQAVASYLVSDVPVGSYLSGGLDSTLVTERASREYRVDDAGRRRIGGSNLHTFSIGFDVAEHTELHYAAEAAEKYGTIHEELIVTREMAHELDATVLGLFDEPFAASSTIPMTFLARLARRKVTVALCGEGGDEVFGGYSWYRNWLKFRRPSFWATRAGRTTRRLLEGIIRRPKRKWRLPALEDVDLYSQLMGAVSLADQRRIFHPDLLDEALRRDPAWYFRQHWRRDLPAMARMQLVDMMTFLPDLNLTRADRTSMHFSLELRVPLLHHELVEYCAGVGGQVRNPDRRLKGLVKDAMRDRLPESIRTRKKKGFSAPVRQWFTSEDLVALVAELRATHGELARSWLHPRLDRYAATVKGSRAYKLWIFLQWLRDRGQ
jgi:asparagine synthase (glutamine-hydrolysing)